MCGDAFDLPVPRPHEIGGLYGRGELLAREIVMIPHDVS